MDSSRFLLPWYMDDAAAIGQSSEETGFESDNVVDIEERGTVWRASSATTAYVDIQLDDDHPVNLIAILNHNMDYDSSFTLRGGSTQGAEDLYADDTFDCWEPLWGVDECVVDDHGADGYLTYRERDMFYPFGSVRLYYLSDTVNCEYWRLSYSGNTWGVTTENPNGYIETGAILLGPYIESDSPVNDTTYVGPQDDGNIIYNEAGGHWKDRGASYRGGEYPYSQQEGSAIMGAWYDMLQELGTGKSFIADWFYGAGSQALRVRNQMYCHLTTMNKPKLKIPFTGDLVLKVRESG
jgi:hypothetical protein